MTILSEAEELAALVAKEPAPKVEAQEVASEASKEYVKQAQESAKSEQFKTEQAQSVPSPVNDVKDTVNTFMDKVALAQMHGDYFVETSPQVFDHYMRGQNTPYFLYQGIRVYKYGEREAIEAAEARKG